LAASKLAAAFSEGYLLMQATDFYDNYIRQQSLAR
jgi:hypothetical protein